MMQPQHLGCLRYGLGVPFLLAGIVIVPGAFLAPERVRFTSDGGSVSPPPVTAAFGLCFLVCGLFALRLDRLAGDPRSAPRWVAVIGLVFGLAMTAAALLDDSSSMPSGRLPLALAGMIFVFAGATAAIATLPEESTLRRRAENPVAVVLLSLFGALFTTMALSPHLEGSGLISVLGFSFPSPKSLDRMVIAFIALVIDTVAVAGWIRLIRIGFTTRANR